MFPVLSMAALLFAAQADFRGAVSALEKTERAAPSNPETYVALAAAHLNLNETAAAFDACRRGLKAAPGSARLEQYYVSVIINFSAPAERAERLDEALTIAPASPYFKLALGRVLAEADWHDNRAEGLLREAARKLPRSPEARYRYGDWLCSHTKNESCISEMSAALALDRNNPVAQMQGLAYIANAHDLLDHAPQAEDFYRKALAVNATLPAPNYQIQIYFAKFLAAHEKEQEAESLLQNLVRRVPDLGPAHRELARLYSDAGRLEEAVAAAQRALQLPQGDKEAERSVHVILAKSLFALGKEDEAREHQRWVESH